MASAVVIMQHMKKKHGFGKHTTLLLKQIQQHHTYFTFPSVSSLDIKEQKASAGAIWAQGWISFKNVETTHSVKNIFVT